MLWTGVAGTVAGLVLALVQRARDLNQGPLAVVLGDLHRRAPEELAVEVAVERVLEGAVVIDLARLEGVLRPHEMGHPFGAIGFPGGFTDSDHADHIHIGFDY